MTKPGKNQFAIQGKSFFDITGVMFVILDARGVVKQINRKGCEVLGYPKKEILEKNWFDHFLPRNVRKEVRKVHRQLMTGEIKPMGHHQNPVLTRTGELRIISWHISALKDNKGEITGILGSGEDITRLQESEDKYRTLFETMEQGVVYQNAAGEITSANPAAQRILGLSLDQMQGRTSMDPGWKAVDKDMNPLPGEKHPVMIALGTNKPVNDFLMGVHNPRKGEYVWIIVNSIPQFREDSEKPFQVYSTFLDITGRKKAEKALKKNEEKYRLLVENSIQGVVIAQADPVRLVFASSAMETITGYSVTELTEMKPVGLTELIHPEDRGGFFKNFQERLAGKTTDHINEYRVIDKTGTVKWVVAHSNRIEYEGEPATLTTFINITDRKQAEQALIDRENYLRSIFKAVPVGIGTVSNRILETVNKRLCDMLGYTREELIGKEARILYPTREDYEYVGKEKYDQIDKTGTGTVETRFQKKDGRIIEVLLSSTPIDREKPTVNVTFSALDITEWKKAKENLKESEHKYYNLIQQSNDAIYLLYKNRFEVINKKFEEIFGITQAEANAPDFNFMSLVAPESKSDIERRSRLIKEGREPDSRYEFTALNKKGEKIEVEASVSYIDYKDGIATQGVLRDITARKELQQQLRQSQQMESIGRLAGGVAHDMNNLLTPIVGYSEILRERFKKNPEIIEYVDGISKAGVSAATLVSQLLTFSRKQEIVTKPLNLNEIIEDFSKLIRKTISEDIRIRYRLAESLPETMADRGQLEQVIMNIIVNAGDAMPRGGSLSIETKPVEIDDEYTATHDDFAPGRHIQLSISDTGTGMNKTTRERIFDPFFTTKGERGTGMGLSTVYGIVKKHQGDIHVYSEPGKGTTFRIFLPCLKKSAQKEIEKDTRVTGRVTGSETILLTEDSEEVLKLTRNVLERNGYTVICAASGEEALEKIKPAGTRIDLLLTDIILPGFNGKKLYEKLSGKNPELKVIYMSGYTDQIISEKGIQEDKINFLSKPFEINELILKIRKVLDG